jgi:hypothetical protein
VPPPLAVPLVFELPLLDCAGAADVVLGSLLELPHPATAAAIPIAATAT